MDRDGITVQALSTVPVMFSYWVTIIITILADFSLGFPDLPLPKIRNSMDDIRFLCEDPVTEFDEGPTSFP